ncbi:MAG: transporter permease protein [Myxococcaceae bacterium]|nr:transporter permease protein [Myxococcaceae bacterium]
MVSFLLRRLVTAVFVLWLVMSGVFVLVNVVGDPARAALGEKASTEQLNGFRAKHGLDRPLGQRYGRYLSDLATLQLGTSFQDEQPVSQLIARRLPRTLLLGALALSFELLLGLGAGVLAALYKKSWFDTAVMGVSFVGISMPSFITGLWFLGYFAFRLGWFPIGGYGVTPLDHVYHAILPALTLAVIGAATYARLMRGELIEALQSDYVRTARAKGLSMTRVVLVHATRNALTPIVTLLSVSLRVVVSGAVITETIFGWPGMGRLAFEAISGLDLPVVLGIVFVACGVVQLGNILADVAVVALDPRLRDRR